MPAGTQVFRYFPGWGESQDPSVGPIGVVACQGRSVRPADNASKSGSSQVGHRMAARGGYFWA